MDIFSQQITPKTLTTQVGSSEQVAGIRQFRLDDGPQKGGRLIQVRNAAGLCVDLLPDRCLDIGQVWAKGIPFAWLGPWGLPSKGSGVSMDTALGGLMATCGFDHIRQPVHHAGHDYPLHGNMALTPCKALNVHDVPDQGGDMTIEATTYATAPDGAGYTLKRRITIPFERNEIRLEDEITTTPASPVFGLYHINLGFPLIGKDTNVTVNGASMNACLTPVDSPVQISPAPSEEYTVSIDNTTARVGLDVLCNGSELPWLQTYRRAEDGMNLFCIEPVTHDRKPRSELLGQSAQETKSSQKISLQFLFRS